MWVSCFARWLDDDLMATGLRQLARKSSPIEKYQYLSQLRNSNVHLFYRLVVDRLKVA